jgi:Xaa-Pro aminopeptidase
MSEGRADQLAEAVAAAGLDQLIVGDLVRPGDSGPDAIADARWLTGFSGSSALALVGPGEQIFITDFRYAERVKSEVMNGFEPVILGGRMLPGLVERLHGRVGYDDSKTSVATLRKLEQEVGEGVELVPAPGLVSALRRHKSPAEVAAMAAAASVADEVYEWLAERGFAGRTEREVALAAEVRMRELGAEGSSFPPIVAAGPNAAVPHHDPTDREIAAGELVLIDMGAVVDGYCSDCTRTFAVREVSEKEHEVYALVLAAQRAGLDAVSVGVEGREADAASRQPIDEAGHGEHYGHGLGHGVGIEVHEAPRLAKTSEDTLEAGDAVTVEPGIYLPGEFGVRIEDLVIVTDDGPEILTRFTKDLLSVN